MKVVKRSGILEDVKFDQITDRLRTLSSPDLSIDPVVIARSVCSQIKDCITTRELDELSATVCASLSIQEPAYDVLATRILMTSHEKDTPDNYVDVVDVLQSNRDVNDQPSPILDSKMVEWIRAHRIEVATHFDECRHDHPLYQMSLFGWKTLYRSYLLQSNRKVVERPEHLFYRVALSLHYPDLERTKESYAHLANGNFIHATPTLFHAGTKRPQMSSCFLTTSTDDVEGIYHNISKVAEISKWAGGIGVHISHIRARDSYIRGTNGKSNGIMPMLKVYESTSRYIDQCVEASTPVYTLDGPKEICQLEPNKDFVLQRNGRYQLLHHLLEHPYNDDMLTIHLDDGTHFKITPFHPVYSRGRGASPPFESPEKRGAKPPLLWVDADELRVDDELAFPIPVHTVDQDDWQVDTLFCWGLMLGWGRMRHDDPTVEIDFPIQTPTIISETFQLLLSTNMIPFQTMLCDETMTFKFKITNHFPLKYVYLYDHVRRCKRIHPLLLQLPHTKLLNFVHGFLTSHGCGYEGYDMMMANDFKTEMSTPQGFDPHVLEALSYIFTRLGLCMKRPEGHDDKLRIERTSSNTEEYVYQRIVKIERSSYQGLLYDLEFKPEHQHNYVISRAILHNGGGKRKGSFAMYIEPWHADIYEFVFAKRNTGNEHDRARDLFYGLWIPDLFMKRVATNDKWSLMCPNVCQGLVDCYGEAFEELYTKYEAQGKFVRQIQARDLWKEILHSQIETGLPYMLYKDSCNRKSNQQNLGTIRSSNLCCEIIEYSNDKEYSVCNLASINLSSCVRPNARPKPTHLTLLTKSTCVYCRILKRQLERHDIPFTEVDVHDNQEMYDSVLSPDEPRTVPKILVKDDDRVYGYTDFWKTYLQPEFDFDELGRRVAILVVNMNRIIDKNFYPTPETEVSNRKHRPIGIGVQGLADLFCKFQIPFDSDQARHLNRKIFETMYFHALQASHDYAVQHDCVYSTFEGSPLSQGRFHFDLCPELDRAVLTENPVYDWDALRKTIVQDGVANSLLIAPMPTASTSQILYQNECFEPYTSNLYVRRTLAGEHTIFNKYLVQDLQDAGLWNQHTIDHLIVHKGSVQNLTELPTSIRQVYRTAWEIPQKSLIDMAAERQWFIDQSQSFNIFVANPSLETLTKIHFYGWKRGLKTGSYYTRTKPQHFSQNFTIDPQREKELECMACSA